MPRPLRNGRYSASAEAQQTTFRPQLTSLIDVMTFLLVFLIKSFSVQGDVITPSTNLELPESSSHKSPKPAASIEITQATVMTEGKVLSSLSAADKSDPLLIPGVYKWMLLQHSRFSDTSRQHEVLIQADREIEYSNLKRVMYSCNKAGFMDFTILAIQKE
jgi:biopolymer transport protein ExbD